MHIRPTAHPAERKSVKKSHGAVFAPNGNPRGRPWPAKASGVMCRPPGVLGWRFCSHGVLWWPTGRGLGRVLLLWRGPAVASLGPLWSPWGNPRPRQWPPDPQGPWQRPPVGWGWYGAVCRACECRNAHSKCPPTALCFVFVSCGTWKTRTPAQRHQKSFSALL